MDVGALITAAIAGGGVSGVVQAVLQSRNQKRMAGIENKQTEIAKEQVHAQEDAVATERYDELVQNYERFVGQLQADVANLRRAHQECETRLADSERVGRELRDDVVTLRRLVVAQIHAEAAEEEAGK